MHPIWGLLSHENIVLSPGIPWAPVVMLALLWVLWQFLDGRIGPRSSGDARRALLKWKNLPRPVWTWSLIAGGLAMISMAMIDTQSVLFGSQATLNAALAAGFADLPLPTGIAFAVTASLLAAMVEESAFRGYMQSDLSRRFRPGVVIALVAVTFAIFHLYGRTLQQWIDGFPDWVVISAIFSLLVYLTGSILPCLVCHFVVDLALFSLDWFDDPLRTLRVTVAGPHVSRGCVVCITAAVLSGLAFRKLATMARTHAATLAP